MVTRFALLPWLGESRASPRFRAPRPRSKASKPLSVTPSPFAPSSGCTRRCGMSPRQQARRGYPVPAKPATGRFGARLAQAVEIKGALCAGIDPHPALLELWGCREDVGGVYRFARRAVEALGRVAEMIKPLSPFFERYGEAGIAVLER